MEKGKICPLTREEAVRQLSDLRDHCRSMISGDNDYPEWALDVEALDMAIAALRPVSREQIKKVWRGCKHCGEEWGTCNPITNRFTMPPPGGIRFCPMCGAPLTDEAVDIELRRWKEAVRRG